MGLVHFVAWSADCEIKYGGSYQLRPPLYCTLGLPPPAPLSVRPRRRLIRLRPDLLSKLVCTNWNARSQAWIALFLSHLNSTTNQGTRKNSKSRRRRGESRRQAPARSRARRPASRRGAPLGQFLIDVLTSCGATAPALAQFPCLTGPALAGEAGKRAAPPAPPPPPPTRSGKGPRGLRARRARASRA
jgi:hypothetical protein